MKQYLLKEDRLSTKLTVVFSPKISKQINIIDEYNYNDIDNIHQWYDYLEGIKRYISNPVIAFDYTNRYRSFPNGTRFIHDFDYNIGYTIKSNKYTNSLYVYIFNVNLEPDEYGLKVPPTLQESKSVVRLTESDLRFIVTECVRKIIENTYSKRMYINTNKSYKTNFRNII